MSFGNSSVTNNFYGNVTFNCYTNVYQQPNQFPVASKEEVVSQERKNRVRNNARRTQEASSTAPQTAIEKPRKKRLEGPCFKCTTDTTPEWRRGKTAAVADKILCNACGLADSKKFKREKEEEEFRNKKRITSINDLLN